MPLVNFGRDNRQYPRSRERDTKMEIRTGVNSGKLSPSVEVTSRAKFNFNGTLLKSFDDHRAVDRLDRLGLVASLE